jgi:hypothetical protein
MNVMIRTVLFGTLPIVPIAPFSMLQHAMPTTNLLPAVSKYLMYGITQHSHRLEIGVLD